MTHVTTANLETVRESLPLDQRVDLKPGCITWPIREGAITTYRRLRAQAARHGLTVSEHLRSLLDA